MTQVLKSFVFENKTQKTERTHEFTGKVLFAEQYTAETKNGKVPGLKLTIEGLGHTVRLLNGSIKGASAHNPGSLLRCVVKLTGVIREYNDTQFFDPRDLEIVQHSTISQLAASGIGFSGSLID